MAYKSTDVQIKWVQATFTVRDTTSFQMFHTQFPFLLSWAVTIPKWYGLTLPEIIVNISTGKQCYSAGQAYVSFSRVTKCNKFHIINYTRSKIHVSENVEEEMDHLHKH